MFSNTTGNQNAGFGAYSLTNNTLGSNNMGSGANALLLNTEGNDNAASGSAALYNNSIGSLNTATGSNSLFGNTSGSSNTASGYHALLSNSTGSFNSALGRSANVASGNLTNATAIGARSLVSADNALVLGSINGVNGATATVNVGIGTTTPLDRLHVAGNIRMVDGNQGAGKVLTSDSNGTATWQNASANAWGLTGNVGTTAGTNFIGTTDDVDLVFKRNNILGGKLGNTNASFGLYSLFSNTTGNYNVAIGSTSMFSNTSGSNNLAIGWGSLNSNTTGASNTAVGYSSLYISNADSNTAIGSSALYNTTTGSNNTATGTSALRSNMVGANNTAVGQASLFDSLGNDNTAVGYQSLMTNRTGSKNTALGFQAAVSVNSLTNATAIGAGASVSTSNSLVLGSINGVNGATSSVNVGIGTTSPSARLEVVDEDATTGGAVPGNLHVMTNSPQNVDVGAAITLGGYYINSSTADRIFGSVEGRKATNLTGTSSGYLMFKTNNTGTLTERMRITNTGNVGIGTAAPGGLFELSLNEGRKPASNTWTITSDSRLKNVNGIYEKGLAEILQLKPIRYNYKNTEKRTFDPKVLDKEAFGFLAQEVQPLFPEAVGTDPDGYLNFDLHPILIASINALKELNAKNEQLEQKSIQLEKENQSLKESVQAINDKMLLIIAEMEKLKK
jgi:hypothetical protein